MSATAAARLTRRTVAVALMAALLAALAPAAADASTSARERRALKAAAARAKKVEPRAGKNVRRGERRRPARRRGRARASIINGYRPSSTAWPWMVSLQTKGAGTPLERHFCGGALVAPRVVLTAAHCFKGVTEAGMEVVSGRHDLNDTTTGQRHDVISGSIRKHPNYTGAKPNDVAVLTLASDASQATTRLVEPGTGLWDVSVLGWGDTEPMHEERGGVYVPSAQRMAADLTVWNDATCQAYFPQEYDAPTMLCAGGPGEPDPQLGTATCRGDSGSPVMTRDAAGQWRIAGIVSFGEWTCDAAPSVFAWVGGSALRTWTVNAIEQAARVTAPAPANPTPAGPNPAPAGPAPAGPAPAGPGPQAPRLSGRTVRVTRTGYARLRIACPAGQRLCSGTVRLRTTGRVAGRKVTFGLAAFHVTAGRTAVVKVLLSPQHRRLLARLRSVRTSASFLIRDVPAGASTVQHRVLLRAP